MTTTMPAMTGTPAGILPVIDIDRDSNSPLHKQVYDSFRTAILRGEILSGQQVPSSRELATAMRISRFPVLHAYAQLSAEGYFETRTGSGTFVASSLPEQLTSIRRDQRWVEKQLVGPRPVSRRMHLYGSAERLFGIRGIYGWGAFSLHQPAFEQFPFKTWASLVARHSRNPQISAIHQVNPLGSERFRKEICAYLRTARGVKCDPGQVMIVSGSQQAIDLTARVLLDPGSPVWVENPGYSLQQTVLRTAGCRMIPIPVDKDGMDVAFAVRQHPAARAAFVIPSHQYPLGYTMSATRRLQLLNWAQTAGAWIVEDDYDSEYRYETGPIASLQGLDVNERVIYIGTFSKVLFPSVRIGYMVLPPDLVESFAAVRFAMDIFSPYLHQEVLADFMAEGHFARHIRRMRQLYGERRKVLVRSLREEFGDSLEVLGADAGLHVTVTLPDGHCDRELAARAATERVWLWPLSAYYVSGEPRNGFVLGFGSTSVEQIPRAVRLLRSLIQS